jgi:SAM-dependent methyltransferase
MNLVDMATRKDRHLELQARLVSLGNDRWKSAKMLVSHVTGRYIIAAKRTIGGIQYRGFDVSADDRTRVIIRSVCAWYPFRLLPDSTGWSIVAMDRRAEGRRFNAVLKERSTGRVLAARSVQLTSTLQPVAFPGPPGVAIDAAAADLQLEFCGTGGGRAFLAVHRVLDRNEVIALCRGKGVELGPGPHPQVLPDDTREVLYVEQSRSDEWNTLYNEKRRLHVDQQSWSKYTIGEAFPLPVEDSSLDFIFSSHVFEHLANPLGHLEHWYAKLRHGGLIVGIVPDVGGSKDYVFEPCSVTGLLEEHASKQMQPQLSHYRKWAAARAPGKDPADYLKSKRSIHVHFYTAATMQTLLELAIARLGYRTFRIWHTANHKDFYFALEK